MKFEIEQGRNKKWFWRLKAANGKILAHSEIYSSKAKALQTVESLEGAFKAGTVAVYVDGNMVLAGENVKLTNQKEHGYNL